ncbi:MAG: hypothetical protein RL407_671 [Bacteroidota bacterium]|jgi:hypothetical protein
MTFLTYGKGSEKWNQFGKEIKRKADPKGNGFRKIRAVKLRFFDLFLKKTRRIDIF